MEASAEYASNDERWGAGGTFTWMRGRETPQGASSQQMTGYRIPPLKLTGHLQFRPVPQWNNRLQATFVAGHDYRLNCVDTVTVGIQNLLNRYYYPFYSQLLRNSNNTSHLSCGWHHAEGDVSAPLVKMHGKASLPCHPSDSLLRTG